MNMQFRIRCERLYEKYPEAVSNAVKEQVKALLYELNTQQLSIETVAILLIIENNKLSPVNDFKPN